MKRLNPSQLGIIAALACACAGGALAQEQPTTTPAGAHAEHGPMAKRQHMQEKRAAQLKALHDALNIRPEQETAFSTFAAAMTPPPGAEGHHHRGDATDSPQALTTPQRLDRMAQRMDAREARMKQVFERRAAATKALYAALSPDRQRTMDALHGLMGHEGRHGGDHHGGAGQDAWGSGQG